MADNMSFVDGVSKRRRGAAEYGGAGLLKVSKLSGLCRGRDQGNETGQVSRSFFDVWRPGVGISPLVSRI